MIVSEARIAANQANGAKGQGPLTPETRAISARNGLKHGLTGKGIVTSELDREEIGRRVEALTDDLKPISAAGIILIAQMATLSVRAERAARHESAATAMRVRHAADEFDEHRIDQAEALFKVLADDPRNNLRKLRKSPKGVARLIDEWRDLKADLGIQHRQAWLPPQVERAGYLLGLKSQHAQGSRIGALSRAFWGDFADLNPLDGVGLDDATRRAWAKAELFKAIDAEIAALEDHHLTLDFETIDLDRAESGARALFDASKAATLARRYESEARRGIFKALQEFRKVEAEAAANPEAMAAPPEAPRTPPAEHKVGSSRENPAKADREPLPIVDEVPMPIFPGGMDRDGQPLRIDRPSKTPG